MENYRLDILGLSEVRWPESGEFQTQNGGVLLYAGQTGEDTMHRNGVGFLLSKSSKKSLLEWKPVSERIITARFKTNVRYVTVTQCYAPTEIPKGELKDAFYTELNGVLRQTNSRDIKILMGDLNAKVGPENEGLEHIMGVHGLGIRNVNGEMLIDTCAEHDLVIGGTLFPHRNCHRITWVSPDHVTENQIDQIVISRKFRNSLLDVRNRRGADVGSDHHLVLAEFRLQIVANRTKLNHRCKKIDVARLKDQQIKETYALELQNRFQVLSGENFMEEGIETCWQKIKDRYLDVGEKILGFKAHQRKE
ncbi:craniofacial development protein 2-like [Schistocerca piceifrons]|uniref:craniofacial development protein 2-like n=1 Tax=Schistocerca piceifrons TaxID=274613 RepID=UPI001F5F5CCE|nr:craniofacial development protein 2-like [Schistocerca piceifrons]